MTSSLEQRWGVDAETGEDIMPPLQRKYLEEMCATLTPTHETVEQWCDDNHVSPRATRRWKKQPKFIKQWEMAATDAQASPEFVSPIIANMHRIASSNLPGAVKAAELVFKMTERLKPPTTRVEISRDDDFASFSDQELAAFVGTGVDA